MGNSGIVRTSNLPDLVDHSPLDRAAAYDEKKDLRAISVRIQNAKQALGLSRDGRMTAEDTQRLEAYLRTH